MSAIYERYQTERRMIEYPSTISTEDLVEKALAIYEDVELYEFRCDQPVVQHYMVCGIPDGVSGPGEKDYKIRDAARDAFAQISGVLRTREDFENGLAGFIGKEVVRLRASKRAKYPERDTDALKDTGHTQESYHKMVEEYVLSDTDEFLRLIERMKEQMGE